MNHGPDHKQTPTIFNYIKDYGKESLRPGTARYLSQRDIGIMDLAWLLISLKEKSTGPRHTVSTHLGQPYLLSCRPNVRKFVRKLCCYFVSTYSRQLIVHMMYLFQELL